MMFKFLDPDLILRQRYVLKLRIIYLLAVASIVYWGITENVTWWEYILYFYAGLLFARIGSEAGFHRYFSHRSYKTTKFIEKLLLWMGTLNGVGSCISWATMHRIHHRNADHEGDPHSPYISGLIKPFLGIPEPVHDYDHRVTRDLLRDKTQIFTHRHYFKINIAFILFLLCVSWAVGTLLPLIVFYSMATFSLWILYGVTNTLEHLFGYRTYETSCHSGNHHWIRLLWLGAGLHNNHHYNSQAYDFNLRKNWWEFDFDGWLIKTFLKVDKI